MKHINYLPPNFDHLDVEFKLRELIDAHNELASAYQDHQHGHNYGMVEYEGVLRQGGTPPIKSRESLSDRANGGSVSLDSSPEALSSQDSTTLAGDPDAK